jgi:regulator of nucleoside diphosphate kinase
MAERIYISESDVQKLRALIEQHWNGRDGAAAERLAAELDRAIIAPLAQMPADVVTMHSRVAFEDVRSGAIREVVLVYPAASDASAGRLSVLAPIGAALLGLRIGDTIEWPLPDDRTVSLRILAVVPPRGAGESAAGEAVQQRSPTRAAT